MVYGAMIEKGDMIYSDLKLVFESIGNIQTSFNWLITDCDNIPAKIKECYNGSYCWITGRELTEIVLNDHTKWGWAVLAGFGSSISLSEVLKHPLPYADGYPGFWKLPINLQHPLSTIEIVPWDGSCTLLFTKEEELFNKFMYYFSFSKDLKIVNAK